MTRRWLVRSVAAMVAAAWLMPALAAGQETASAPDATTLRTPWGDPDLQGIWSYATFTPLQRPADLAGREFLTPEEVAEQNLADATRASSERRDELSSDRDLALAYNQVWWDRGASTGRTSLIVDPPDGRLPPLTPAAERRQAAQREHRRVHPYDSWEDRPLQERCMTYQRVPPAPSGYSNTYQIFQAPGQVVILNEMIHDVRVVPLDGRPRIDGRIRQWNGDGRGRWDGDTLVVETTHYRDDTTWRGFPGTRDLRAVERFTRIDADTIEYRYTIHDAATYTRPFTVELPLTSPPGYVIYEYACHEGNYGIANALGGERVLEAAGKRGAVGRGLPVGCRRRAGFETGRWRCGGPRHRRGPRGRGGRAGRWSPRHANCMQAQPAFCGFARLTHGRVILVSVLTPRSRRRWGHSPARSWPWPAGRSAGDRADGRRRPRQRRPRWRGGGGPGGAPRPAARPVPGSR